MPLAFLRMKDEIIVGLILSVLLTFVTAVIPNYQQIAYKNTPAAAYDEQKDHTGYPAGKGYPVVHSIAEIEACEHNFVIEIDMADLEKTGVYRYVLEPAYMTNGVMRVINNNEDHGIGRFFVATLESGEQIILFLDDTTLNLPKEGRITLPVGKTTNIKKGSEFFEILQAETALPEENLAWYVNMAGEWRAGEEALKVEKFRWILGVITFVAVWIVEIIVYKKWIKKR